MGGGLVVWWVSWVGGLAGSCRAVATGGVCLRRQRQGVQTREPNATRGALSQDNRMKTRTEADRADNSSGKLRQSRAEQGRAGQSGAMQALLLHDTLAGRQCQMLSCQMEGGRGRMSRCGGVVGQEQRREN